MAPASKSWTRTAAGSISRLRSRRLRRAGIESLVVEGGATVITSFLAENLADRMIVAVAPIVLGSGTEAVKQLGITEVVKGIRLGARTTVTADDDIILAWDIESTRG